MDFSLVLFIILLLTGLVSLGYKVFVESRPAAVGTLAGGAVGGSKGRSQPVVVEYARALFPIILIVFVLRSFIVEPFRIPSGSMLPTLHVGDLILVNKFVYGMRLPIVHRKLIALGAPERGDVMVFRYPVDPKLNFIKRVVGLPGDTLAYHNKQLYVNGTATQRVADGEYAFDQPGSAGHSVRRLKETLGQATYTILLDDRQRTHNMEVVVPEGHYFVMGDNRDHSNDSRYWRFVPERNVVGKAFFIWFNIGGEWSRIGSIID